jgi:Ca2+-binding EF-hand superfamily protein
MTAKMSVVFLVLSSSMSTQVGASTLSSFYRAKVTGSGATAEDTVQALDTNGNGKVDSQEITKFAQSQGMDTHEVLADFKELDVNGDGELDASEIGGLLATSDDSQAERESKALVGTRASQAATIQKVHSTVAQAQDVSAKPEATTLQSLDINALDAHVRQQAGSVVARNLAQRAQLLLANSRIDRQRAIEFESQARDLRANATELAQHIGAETQAAASLATRTIAQKSAEDVKQLQETMTASLAAASEHSERAKKARANVQEVWASVHSDDRV